MSILNKRIKGKKQTSTSFRNPFRFRQSRLDSELTSDTNSRSKLVETPLREKSIPNKSKTNKRGRPAFKNPRKRKGKRFTVCCTEGEMREIRIFAAERDLTVSDLVMRCVCQYVLEQKNS